MFLIGRSVIISSDHIHCCIHTRNMEKNDMECGTVGSGKLECDERHSDVNLDDDRGFSVSMPSTKLRRSTTSNTLLITH
ncbi:hypothetical protein AKJ16_DCAP08289 [Drosera capensis]